MRGSAERVVTTFHTGGIGGSEMKITLPNGESFNGTMVATGSSAGMFRNSAPKSPFGGVDYASSMTSGGILSGNRGHTMWCSFNVVNVVGFSLEGVCDTSDGNVIDFNR